MELLVSDARGQLQSSAVKYKVKGDLEQKMVQCQKMVGQIHMCKQGGMAINIRPAGESLSLDTHTRYQMIGCSGAMLLQCLSFCVARVRS